MVCGARLNGFASAAAGFCHRSTVTFGCCATSMPPPSGPTTYAYIRTPASTPVCGWGSGPRTPNSPLVSAGWKSRSRRSLLSACQFEPIHGASKISSAASASSRERGVTWGRRRGVPTTMLKLQLGENGADTLDWDDSGELKRPKKRKGSALPCRLR